mmetsp:Transcript_5862/g.12916  ORF Transcript_5862/g.12916 Transcript_5862/m.12916 type:complete len:82 (-) Transcript_5862:117-362(-)
MAGGTYQDGGGAECPGHRVCGGLRVVLGDGVGVVRVAWGVDIQDNLVVLPGCFSTSVTPRLADCASFAADMDDHGRDDVGG